MNEPPTEVFNLLILAVNLHFFLVNPFIVPTIQERWWSSPEGVATVGKARFFPRESKVAGWDIHGDPIEMVGL